MKNRESRFELLENRHLLSSVSLVGRDLQISGTDSSDVISIADWGKTYRVLIKQNGATLFDQHFGKTAVDHATIQGLSGDDEITITGSLPTHIYGGYGNDQITGGRGNDVIYGEHGNDLLRGGAGNDTIDGGWNSDTLYGDSGNDVLLGGNGNERIYGGSGDDRIHGGDGTDHLFGEAGKDSIYGDANNDEIVGGTEDDLLVGGDGDDSIRGDAGNDRINGENGQDNLKGGGGNDRIEGGWNSDVIYGDEGNDVLLGGNGNEWIYGGDGDDVLEGGDGNDRLHGEAGHDRLFGQSGADQLVGGAGNDLAYGGTENDVISGGDGTDRLYGEQGQDELRGGPGSDTLDGGWNSDVIYGDGGDDNLVGGNGNDRIYGGTGNDRIDGNDGDDHLFGEDGHDTIYAHAGLDEIVGGAGNDLLYGGAEDDTMKGGAGADSIYGEHGQDWLSGGDDNDRIDGGWNTDRIYGDAGDDLLIGDDGNDRLYGGDGDDTVVAGPGNDYLYGQAGSDLLQGEIGDDVLDGGAGADSLLGGEGCNQFSNGNVLDQSLNDCSRLYVNFDGVTLTSEEMDRYARFLDPENDGVVVEPIFAGKSFRETVIQGIIDEVQKDLNPFGITVQRHYGKPVENQGLTTIFVGPSTMYHPHIASSIDFGNDNPTDIAFVGQEFWGDVTDTITALSDVVLHEAGHTFGLHHVYTVRNGVTYPETMGLRYSTNSREWVQNTGFLNQTFENLDDEPYFVSQNSYQTMLNTFGLDGIRPDVLPDGSTEDHVLPVFESNGDFDRDGTVSGSDFLLWQRSVGVAPAALASDGNHDGVINTDDLGIWTLEYGSTSEIVAVASTSTNPSISEVLTSSAPDQLSIESSSPLSRPAWAPLVSATQSSGGNLAQSPKSATWDSAQRFTQTIEQTASSQRSHATPANRNSYSNENLHRPDVVKGESLQALDTAFQSLGQQRIGAWGDSVFC